MHRRLLPIRRGFHPCRPYPRCRRLPPVVGVLGVPELLLFELLELLLESLELGSWLDEPVASGSGSEAGSGTISRRCGKPVMSNPDQAWPANCASKPGGLRYKTTCTARGNWAASVSS